MKSEVQELVCGAQLFDRTNDCAGVRVRGRDSEANLTGLAKTGWNWLPDRERVDRFLEFVCKVRVKNC